MNDAAPSSEQAGTEQVNITGLPAEFVLAERIQYRLRRVLQRSGAIFNDCLGQEQLTTTQWAILLTLNTEGPLSQVRLGRLTSIDPATTQGVVMRLIERDLVERHTDPRDRRRKSVRLSDSGAALVAGLLPRVAEAHARIMEPLSAQDRDHLLSLLERLS
ncbi:MarR family winged helix-turn-helix transcriptional regulator [Azospirillum halopraeferens]|uniref:MarR family winged helix-turn-helix transcriptional regulator n=1 Tax=Azospirillum halopraeferens TaxID=34010 RepID=UPI0004073310|nr:MarR family transcriptional regulator [Azospirillum halopraeferens]